MIYIFFKNDSCWTRQKPLSRYTKLSPYLDTNISHLVIGIASSSKSLRSRKPYIKSWWIPNVTRGFIFLDRAPDKHLPWPSSMPPYRISEDTSRYNAFNMHKVRHVIRITRVIEELYNAENKDDVRWYVIADDDTILFVNNIAKVLRKYDHNKYFYVGMPSECIDSNALFSFNMAFGGAGYALSYPLARLVAKNLDLCLKRYPTMYGSDQIMHSCIADLGVSLTLEKGFHQIDLHRDIFGLLSAHPQSLTLSLHHLDAVDSIFPSMNRIESVNHLMKAAKADESRLLQQTICYEMHKKWTFSISWGYSIQIYEAIIPPSILQVPLETFSPISRMLWPIYMFQTRRVSNTSCEAAHVFFFNSIEETAGNHLETVYIRSSARGLPACSSRGHISEIRVLAPMRRDNVVRYFKSNSCLYQVFYFKILKDYTFQMCTDVSYTKPKSLSRYIRSSSYLNTDISHLIIGIASSSKSWRRRKPYIESWWKPNATRGFIFLFLDRAPDEHLPWPSSMPPYRISEETGRYNAFNMHKMQHVIRVARVVEETFNAENGDDVRWYLFADDDTILFVNNVAEVLSKYDHREYFYVGMPSESVGPNIWLSFNMAFGGAGYALSYPLAKAVAKNLDLCLKRYPTLYGSDQIMHSCIADLGVSLTLEKGFHQIDLHQDISGLLSAHPQSLLVSLHHLDAVEPIFPSMDRIQSVNHLMKAAKADESRLLQQTICYQKHKNWTFSIAWGYSIHIYETIMPPSILQVPLETFYPWSRIPWPYIFKTRRVSHNSCEAPHVFFFHSIEETVRDHLETVYIRSSARRLPACVSSGNHPADHISEIRVLTLRRRDYEERSRRECCDCMGIHINSAKIKLRYCKEAEILP
ncbi:hypothetical protein AgCh_004001 [Apium graveolens]